MTEVYRVDGAPGVGKSHTLRQQAEKEADNGVGLDQMYYLTFTRSGRKDTVEELAKVFPDAEEDELWSRARTVHGAAWVACGRNGFWCEDDDVDQVIQRGDDDDVYRRFASRHGMRYVGETNLLRRAGEGKDTDGAADKLFAINDWLTLTRRPVGDFHKAPAQLPMPRSRVEELLEAWEAFKLEGRPDVGEPLYEHGDYVDAAIANEYTPDVQVLFIDEFQDLSPQEYLLFKTWRDSGWVDRIYIAGDANQSIYGFRAGTPRYFEETPVDDTTLLKKSYRCPAAITNVASGILESCDETDSKGFTARKDGGVVRSVRFDPGREFADFVSALAEKHADDGGVMLLSRANYQVKAIAKALRGHGVPYDYLGSNNSVWQDPLPELLTALRAMKTGGRGVSKEHAEELLSHAPRYQERARQLGDPMGTVYKADELRAVFAEYDSVEEIAPALSLENKYRTELLHNAVKADGGATPDNVRVGTIHSAKGLEAGVVLLFDAYTSTLEDEYRNGNIQAEEHRLYYVGATRASERLYIVRDFFNGPTAPPLPDPLPASWEVEE